MTNGIDHRGRRPIHWELAEPLGAKWAVDVRILEKDDIHVGGVERRGDRVVGERSVGHATITHDDFLEEGEAESLRRPPFALSSCQAGMHRPTAFRYGRQPNRA